VFDLHHLSMLYPDEVAKAVAEAGPQSLKKGRDKVLGFQVRDFEGQVGSFLPAPLAADFKKHPDRWERLQLEVVERLRGER
jgi:hypothetical protein